MCSLLFLVDKLVGQDKERKSQRQYPTSSGPCILTADQEIGGEESAEQEDPRRESIPDDLRKEPMPARMSLERT
jgi:hypothetical protein